MVPPRVDYEITELGRTTIPVIETLRAWGEVYRKSRAEPRLMRGSSRSPKREGGLRIVSAINLPSSCREAVTGRLPGLW